MVKEMKMRRLVKLSRLVILVLMESKLLMVTGLSKILTTLAINSVNLNFLKMSTQWNT